MPARRLDDHDLAILRLVQQDATIPQREIAERIALSAPAVQRRIARMEREGVIAGTAAMVEPAAVGLPITVVVELTLSDDRSPTVAAAKAFFRAAPEVQQCYWVTGASGFVLILVAESLGAYEAISSRLFADNEMVRSYRSMVVLDRVKVGAQLPI
ncbi:MAG TPA: Lrp/AsnC family transcriptional regulator [Novosphingobium sp.]|nr:Lrp/AsnC family transcriptional regulator [Novosphingobium sp.]HZV08190.1 Lrp/AsnC family transcriptional regulator [Novosphingobium sp.]